MKNIILSVLVFISFTSIGISQKKYDEFIKLDNDFIRLELNYGPYYSCRIFYDGVLYKTIDTNGIVLYKFYSLRDIDYYQFYNIQKILHKENLINYDSIIRNKNMVSSANYYHFLVMNKKFQINKIEWRSGKDNVLEKLLELINEMIPESDRKLFRINR